MSLAQLAVYARDLKALWQREREQREAFEKARGRLAELDPLKADFLSPLTHELLTPFCLPRHDPHLELLRQPSEEHSAGFREALDDLVAGIAGAHRRIEGVVKFTELATKQREPNLGWHRVDHVIPSAAQAVAVIARGRDVDFRVLVSSKLPEVPCATREGANPPRGGICFRR